MSAVGKRRGYSGPVLLDSDVIRWRCRTKIEKFDASVEERVRQLGLAVDGLQLGRVALPFEVDEREGNLLMYGGASCLWQCLIGNGTGTAAQTLTYFNNGNAYIGSGGGAGATTAAAATQTDLQGASKLRKAMDATYPSHTDGTGSGAATITFRSTFATGDANWQWDEWGTFNGSSGGRMLNRKVENVGTKTSAAAWVFTITIALS